MDVGLSAVFVGGLVVSSRFDWWTNVRFHEAHVRRHSVQPEVRLVLIGRVVMLSFS